MSAKDEILQINQDISAIDKKIFEIKIKHGQISKEIENSEFELKIIEAQIKEADGLYNAQKTKDIVDINQFGATKALVVLRNEELVNVKFKCSGLKKSLKDIDNIIIELEKFKQSKKQELSNNYGQIKEFKPKSNSNS